ncbi:hypothetical protein [Anaerocolumna sp. MB42-C2]|uniref:hypothetical protein n=1 Tax=Anaerocolumna sp. MB42-C2 TaxID=3070997 RepID=UPI0027DF7DC5|nr:hypothetical protein [Anaerocolumna sp. MB42-C2]WMJ85694.1 hypothetical protein RBU59_16665 [Anaerocolumna sp. MB42-C2]
MRKSKKCFALIVIGVGIIMLILSLIKAFPTEFFIAIGAMFIGWGIVSFAIEHFVHKVARAKIMDDDERNILINGKAYTITSEFSNLGIAALGLYLYLKHDMTGFTLAIILFLLLQFVFVIAFRYFDVH